MARKKIILGCIADDFTGATDLANNLVRSGMRTIQTVGVIKDQILGEVDAVVVALKSRTIEPAQAIELSLEALEWLKSMGAEQIYFKYCSTFDSTERGNIGPVTQALMSALKTDLTVVTPAFPDNGRTIVKGHLFVGDVLLQDSSMRNHPLTPMTDSSLVRLMQAQFKGTVGLIDYKVVAKGEAAVRERMNELRTQGVGATVVDALSNDDLMVLGQAVRGMPLITAGSGLAIGLAQNFGIKPSSLAVQLPKARGFKAILSGSCSEMTLKQVKHFKSMGYASFEIDPLALNEQGLLVKEALSFAAKQFAHSDNPILIYSSADPQRVKQVQNQFSTQRAGEMVEHAMGELAKGLVQIGVGQLLVAGGETSGVCVQSLSVTQLQIGPQIDPGVPWCFAPSKPSSNSADTTQPIGIHLALKSGNFGREDFFTHAWSLIGETPAQIS
jgi:uncharacterized protein YgbK (DUF1537 family)